MGQFCVCCRSHADKASWQRESGFHFSAAETVGGRVKISVLFLSTGPEVLWDCAGSRFCGHTFVIFGINDEAALGSFAFALGTEV